MKIDIQKLKEVYLTVNEEDDDYQMNLKNTLLQLSPVELRYFLVYTETQSYRETAKIIGGISYGTARNRIVEIQNKIKKVL